MRELKEAIQMELDDLKRVRDELRVQAALAKAEFRDTFHRLEARWPEVEEKAASLERASTQAFEELGQATRELMTELRTEYRKLKGKAQG